MILLDIVSHVEKVCVKMGIFLPSDQGDEEYADEEYACSPDLPERVEKSD